MFENESKYINPLVAEIDEAFSLLNYFVADLLPKSDPVITIAIGAILPVFPIVATEEQMDVLLKAKGIPVNGSPMEKVAVLSKNIFTKTDTLVSKVNQQKNDSERSSQSTDKESINRADVLNAVGKMAKASDLVKAYIKDPNLVEIFKIIAPDDFVCKSTDEYGRLLEYFHSLQEDIETRVNNSIPEYIFQLMGEYWEIRFGDDIIRLKDSKGLKYIHSLLKNPYQPIRSDSLTAPHVNVNTAFREVTSSQVMEKEAAKIRYAPDEVYVEMTNKIKELEEIFLELTPGSDEYFLAEEHIKSERKKRSNYFNRAGQERPHDDGEKARQAVYTAITTAKKRINKNLPSLFAHLQRYLNTGFECIYDPPPSELKSWHF